MTRFAAVAGALAQPAHVAPRDLPEASGLLGQLRPGGGLLIAVALPALLLVLTPLTAGLPAVVQRAVGRQVGPSWSRPVRPARPVIVVRPDRPVRARHPEAVALAASRRRLVEAQLDRRRLLERDLHDLVQQRLLALVLRLGAARSAPPTRAEDVTALIDRVRLELHETLEQLRALSQGIHPAVLDAEGLRAALDDVAGRLSLPVAVHGGTARHSPAVEALGYDVVHEVLQHLAAACAAGRARVDVADEPGRLLLRVSARAPGPLMLDAALCCIGDRVAALGGTVGVHPGPDGAPSLEVVLPCV